ncbi:protein GOLVEN 6-like [Salvia miltiorrhiza]|uniref:protein GOLVEN 6-like n=1 Tax=Salvia miltiorrhiza TaxID=226208 RepID=UPI0025ABE535|nr:protein GOLVEN 6-like [Salvia miltiorrhiza]
MFLIPVSLPLSLSLCYKSQVSESKNWKTTQLKTLLNPELVLLMELLTLMVSLLLAISFLLSPCASDHLNLNKPIQQGDHAKFAPINLNHQTMKSSAEEETLQASSGTKQHEKEENVMNAAEKEEGPNKSEYFTMDYGWVKRRRPIHNKQIPFVP